MQNSTYMFLTMIFRDLRNRFRFGISELYAHKLRFCSEPSRTVCPLCSEQEEDEMRLLLLCPALCDLYDIFICPHVHLDTGNPLSHLLLSCDMKVIRSVGTFLYRGLQGRSEALEQLRLTDDIFPE